MPVYFYTSIIFFFQNKENECVVFGSALQSIPANYVDDCGYVPK